VLIDIELEGPFPDYVDFINDKDIVMREQIKYELMPLKCNHWNMYGHTEMEYIKKAEPRQEWRKVANYSLRNEQRIVHPSSETVYGMPTRTSPRAALTIQGICTTSSNAFQALLETESIDLVNHETGISHPPMDNILSWNIRGLNGLNKQEDIVLFLNENSIEMVGFLKTKVKAPNHDRVAKGIGQGWHCHSNHQPIEKHRIWVAWKPNRYEV